MRAENGYKGISEEEIMEDTKKAIQGGHLLSYPASYWQQFIKKDGTLDKEKLVKNGYDNEGQADDIEQEMIRRGWLEGELVAAKKAPVKKK